MDGLTAPAWLLPAWKRSLRQVGATAPDALVERIGHELIERWASPDRAHHNLRRLILVLARVDELAVETHDADIVRIAAWYQGAVFHTDQARVYTRRGGIDERASAELAESELAELGVDPGRITRVVQLIGALARHHVPAGDLDAAALCDANLGSLAVEPQKYATYRREVRQEYAHIPDEDYLQARIAIIDKLLARPALFVSPMGQAWESQARENLQAERTQVAAHLTTLTGAETAAAPEVTSSAPPGQFQRVLPRQGPLAAPAQPERAAPAQPERAAGLQPPTGPIRPERAAEPDRPGSRERAATPEPSSPANTEEPARPLFKDIPKGRTPGPLIRRINRTGQGPIAQQQVPPPGKFDRTATPVTPARPSVDSPDDGEDGSSTMTRPPAR